MRFDKRYIQTINKLVFVFVLFSMQNLLLEARGPLAVEENKNGISSSTETLSENSNTALVPPSNDDLCNAIPLTVGDLCSGYPYTNLDATDQSGEGEPGACGGEIYHTVWFSFVGNACNETNINTFIENEDAGIEIVLYTEGSGYSCTDLTTIVQVDCSDPFSGETTLAVNDLIEGQNYYVRIQFVPPSDDGAFCVEILNGNPGPESAALSGDGEMCSGGGTFILVDIVGGNYPFTVEYTDGTDDFMEANYESGAGIFVEPNAITTYSLISVYDACGVAADISGTATIIVIEGPGDAVLSGDQSVCTGQGADLTLTLSGGSFPMDVQISDGMDIIDFFGYDGGPLTVFPAATTTYTLIAIINNCGESSMLTGSATVTIIEAPESITISGDATICSGGDATLFIDIVGGIGPFELVITDGTNNYTLSDYNGEDLLTPILTETTTYTIVSLTNDCGEASTLNGSATITVLQTIESSTLSGDNTICNGESSELFLEIVGGNAPYTIIYNDGTTDITIDNYDGGTLFESPTETTTYTLINVTDACGDAVTISGNATITVNNPPESAVLSGDDLICNGESSELFLDIVGGNAPFTVIYNDGTTDIIIDSYDGWSIFESPLGTTTYTLVNVTDDCGDALSISGSATFTVNDGPSNAFLTGGEVICEGESAELLLEIIDGVAPYTVVYSDGVTEVTIDAYDGGAITVMPSTTTTYSLISVSDDCNSSPLLNGSVTIEVIDAIDSATLSGDNTISPGESSDLIIEIVGGTPPYTLVYNDGTSDITINNYDGSDISVTPEMTTTYTLVNISDACGNASTISGSATVIVISELQSATITGDNIICAGESSDLILDIIGGIPPYTIVYNDGIDDITIMDYINGPITVTPEQTTTYTLVNVSDANGSAPLINGSVTIEVINVLESATLSGDNTISPGESSDLNIEIAGGTPPYTLVYNNGTSDITINNYDGGVISVTPAVTTTYTLVNVSDVCGNASTISGTATITVIDMVASATLTGENTICAGESSDLVLDITGGTPPYTVVYNDGSNDITITNFTNALITVSPEQTTTYTLVSVSDANSSAPLLNGAVTITVNPLPTFTLTDQFCDPSLEFYSLVFDTEGDVVTSSTGVVTDNGGNSYTVSGVAEGSSVNISIEISATGCMIESMINSPNCDCATVSSPVSNGDQAICEGEIIPALSVMVENGQTVDWYDVPSGGTLLIAGTNNFTPISEGIYYAETRDVENGCVSIIRTAVELIIHANPQPAIEGDMSLCLGQTDAVLTAGSGYSIYSWSDGSNTPEITVAQGGDYSVTVTDGNGCVGDDEFTVMSNDLPTVDITGNSEFCIGQGSADLDAGFGFNQYNWSNGQNSQLITVLEGGTFMLTVTDENGCYAVDDITVVANDIPSPEITGPAALCSGQGSIVLDAGSGFTDYLWSTEENTQSIVVSAAGNFGVTVTDGNGCFGSTLVSINEFEAPIAEITGNLEFCDGGTTILDAGSGFDNYSWSEGSNSQIISVNSAGSYSVTVTDINGCTDEEMVNVIEIDGSALDVNFLTNELICVGDTVHFIDISELGDLNSDDVSFFWDFGDGTTSTKRDTSHMYQQAGMYDIYLEAFDAECRYVSGSKRIEVMDCPRNVFDESGVHFLNVYPNPTQGEVTMKMQLITEMFVVVELINTEGILMHSWNINDDDINISYDLNVKGIYYFKVKTPFSSLVKKIIVQ